MAVVRRHCALMGLIDDVDCAVVSLDAAASGPNKPLVHLTSIPAFAWVTTGRVSLCKRLYAFTSFHACSI